MRTRNNRSSSGTIQNIFGGIKVQKQKAFMMNNGQKILILIQMILMKLQIQSQLSVRKKMKTNLLKRSHTLRKGNPLISTLMKMKKISKVIINLALLLEKFPKYQKENKSFTQKQIEKLFLILKLQFIYMQSILSEVSYAASNRPLQYF